MIDPYDLLDAAELLIEMGADVNAKSNNGGTPLRYACVRGYIDVAELLIENGADVNAKNECNGGTPLHFACGKGPVNVAELLIENGADVNAEDNDGDTPLRWAMKGGQEEMVNFLLNMR